MHETPPAHPRCRCAVQYREIGAAGQNLLATSVQPLNDGGIDTRTGTGRSLKGVTDVTASYLARKALATGQVETPNGYSAIDHADEVKMARWIADSLGGEVVLLEEANEQNVMTADFLWDGRLWDLKTLSTEKAADSAIRHGLKQIWENVGGLFLEYVGNSLDVDKLTRIIDGRMRRGLDAPTEIVVIRDGKLLFARRYESK